MEWNGMAYLVVWMCVYMVAIDQARLGLNEKVCGEAGQREFLGILGAMAAVTWNSRGSFGRAQSLARWF
jgi:hypothetical protein